MSLIGVGVAGATLIGGGLAAAGGIAGAAISSGATNNAAQTQSQAAQQANALQQSEFNTEQANEQPWLQAGQTALSEMQNPSFQQPFTAADFQEDPGYQFQLQQGQQALQRSAAAQGGLMGGGTMKALANYSQGMANSDYQQAYSNYMNNQNTAFNRLASIAGTGQTATAGVNQAGQTAAGNIGANTMGAANATGAASIAGANAWSGALGSTGNSINNGLLNGQILSRLGQQPTPAPVSTYGGYNEDTPVNYSAF